MRQIDEVVNGSDSVALEEYFEKIDGTIAGESINWTTRSARQKGF